MSNIPRILGPDGLPAGLSPEERFEELVGHYDSYEATSFRLAPYNPDAFISSKGFEALDEMLALGAVRAPLNLIRDAVLYKGWKVVPAVNDRAHADYDQAKMFAEALEYVLTNIQDEAGNRYDFRQSLFEMLYAIHTGFSVQEIIWRVLDSGPYAGRYGLSMLAYKPCKQIGFDLHKRTFAVQKITSYTPETGYQFDIDVRRVLRYTFAPKDGLPHGMGVGRAGYKHSWSVDFLLRFWNIALEIYGSPFILGKAEPADIGFAAAALQKIRQGAAPVLPKNVTADLIETTGASIASFKAACEYHGQQLALLYLGNTLTTGEGQRTGSMALGKVHQSTQEYGLSGRRLDVEWVLNQQFVRRWMEHNWGEDSLALCPRISLGEWDSADMTLLADAFEKLVTGKIMHPAEDQIRERMGLEPISPELKKIMEQVWENPNPAPSTIPATDPAADVSGD